MNTFWKVRIATLLWGFAVSYAFTGRLGFASLMFGTMVVGNTLIMGFFLNDK